MVGHHSSMISEECRNQVIFTTTCCYIKLEFLRPLEREENSLFFSFPGKTTTTTWSITALNCPPVTLDSQEQFQTMPARKSLRLPTSSNDIGSRVSSFLGESGRVNHSLISFIPNNDATTLKPGDIFIQLTPTEKNSTCHPVDGYVCPAGYVMMASPSSCRGSLTYLWKVSLRHCGFLQMDVLLVLPEAASALTTGWITITWIAMHFYTFHFCSESLIIK